MNMKLESANTFSLERAERISIYIRIFVKTLYL